MRKTSFEDVRGGSEDEQARQSEAEGDSDDLSIVDMSRHPIMCTGIGAKTTVEVFCVLVDGEQAGWRHSRAQRRRILSDWPDRDTKLIEPRSRSAGASVSSDT